jgi:PRTRC genetic system protein C
MAIAVQKLIRTFRYNGSILPDIGAGFTADKIKAHYSLLYPELNTCIVEGPVEERTKLVYTFIASVKDKG